MRRFGTTLTLLALLSLAGLLTACQHGGAHSGAAQSGATQSGDVISLRREVSPPQAQVLGDLAARGADGCLLGAPPVPKAPPPPLPLTGTLGLWVAEVDPATLQPLRAVGTNPDSAFPLASTYKQAVLWAVLRAVDAGTLKPSERFDVTRDNQSLGSYPFDGSSVRTLAERMIRNSDNTATDILHRRVGLPAVQNVADDLGLCRTRLIMPTRDWWVMQAGLSRTFSGTGRWAAATGGERERLALLIDADARAYRADYLQRRLDEYFDRRYDPALDLITHNVSTPYEFGTLVASEFLRSGLSGTSQRWQRQVMALGYGKSALKLTHRGGAAYFGGKGGNGWRLLTYSGYVETTDGRHLVYAFMQRNAAQTYTMPNTRRAFAWINAGIQAVLDAPETPAEASPAAP